jgi:hypothetical protein
MKKTFSGMLSIILALLMLSSISCATTTAPDKAEEILESAPIVAPPSIDDSKIQADSLAELVLPQRYIKYESVPRNGEYLVISNDTGYEIVAVDIFTSQMYQETKTMVNLLATETLPEQKSRRILLNQHPALQTALQEQSESVFTLNAIDFEGDRYVQTWIPETDPWHLIITFESLDYTYEESEVLPREGQILIHNRTGVSIEHLYMSEEINEPNTDLLNSKLFTSGSAVRINTEAVPWIADQLPFDTYGHVSILAIDQYGNQYRTQWYPSSDPWDIVLTDDHLIQINYSYDDASKIISNQGAMTIWYLYLVPQATVNAIIQGEDVFTSIYPYSDLLGDDILDIGEQLLLSPDQLSAMNMIEEPFYLLGLDSSDRIYHQPWDVDNPVQIITDQSFAELPLASALYNYATLAIENQTGEDIWFIYLITDTGDEGTDALDDMVLRQGETVSIVPESSQKIRSGFLEHPETPIHIRAYSYDNVVYEQIWSPITDGWSIVFTPQNRIDW